MNILPDWCGTGSTNHSVFTIFKALILKLLDNICTKITFPYDSKLNLWDSNDTYLNNLYFMLPLLCLECKRQDTKYCIHFVSFCQLLFHSLDLSHAHGRKCNIIFKCRNGVNKRVYCHFGPGCFLQQAMMWALCAWECMDNKTTVKKFTSLRWELCKSAWKLCQEPANPV